jgi:hypothetical protein
MMILSKGQTKNSNWGYGHFLGGAEILCKYSCGESPILGKNSVKGMKISQKKFRGVSDFARQFLPNNISRIYMCV